MRPTAWKTMFCLFAMAFSAAIFTPSAAQAQYPDQGGQQGQYPNQGQGQYPDQGGQQAQYPDQGQGQYSEQGQPQGDPPGRAARITYQRGAVSLQTSGANQWTDAERNYPLTSGDRVYVDNGGIAEIQTGQTAIRMGNATDLTITNLTDQLTQLGLAQGTVRLRTFGIDPNATVELDTPNGAITVVRPGDIRVDTSPNGSTRVTVNTGAIQVSGPSLSQEIDPGQAVELTGNDPVQISNVGMPGYDQFDRFSISRDQQILNSTSARYVSRDVVGYDDLDANGNWANTPEAGPVWYPNNVAADWQPYRDGHWAYVEPWGWTWVDNEPWGFAPFHYGRWSYYGNRWGWVPGPVAVAPVYAPALVVFIGGIGIGFGGGGGYDGGFGGGGLSAWFPLGVGEPYVPWYRTSPAYVRQVNVTNINITNIHNTTVVNNYNTFINNTRNVSNVNNINTSNIRYAHQQNGLTAVPARAFAAGQPVARAVVKVAPAQLRQAKIVRQGPVTVRPTQAALARPVTHAAPPVPPARPVVLTRRGPAVATPNARPLTTAPVKLGESRPGQPTRQVRPAPAAQNGRPGQPLPAQNGRPGRPVPPIQSGRPGQPAPIQNGRPGEPVQTGRPGQPAPLQNGRPGQPLPPQRPGPVNSQPAPANARPGQPNSGRSEAAPRLPSPGQNNPPPPLVTRTPPPQSAPNENRLPPPERNGGYRAPTVNNETRPNANQPQGGRPQQPEPPRQQPEPPQAQLQTQQRAQQQAAQQRAAQQQAQQQAQVRAQQQAQQRAQQQAQQQAQVRAQQQAQQRAQQQAVQQRAAQQQAQQRAQQQERQRGQPPAQERAQQPSQERQAQQRAEPPRQNAARPEPPAKEPPPKEHGQDGQPPPRR